MRAAATAAPQAKVALLENVMNMFFNDNKKKHGTFMNRLRSIFLRVDVVLRGSAADSDGLSWHLTDTAPPAGRSNTCNARHTCKCKQPGDDADSGRQVH